jgi:dTDP-4-dehydrorhamnose 3,5-epimerase-like enzyme
MGTACQPDEFLIMNLNFSPRGDSNGWLIALEGQRSVPFQIKRIYYIYGTKSGIVRGKHAHRQLIQAAVCICGSCRFRFHDGIRAWEELLSTKSKGIMIEPMVWHEMDHFSDDCILLVLASDYYDEADYIRDWAQFQFLAAKGLK